VFSTLLVFNFGAVGRITQKQLDRYSQNLIETLHMDQGRNVLYWVGNLNHITLGLGWVLGYSHALDGGFVLSGIYLTIKLIVTRLQYRLPLYALCRVSLPYGEGTEASGGPNAHPRLNP